MVRQKGTVRIAWIIVGLLVGSLVCIPVGAVAIGSGNYQIQEDFIGGGGTVDSSSANYHANDSIGDNAAGASAGGAFGSQSGSQSTDEPTLTFLVDTASVTLGSLSTSLTRTGVATFSILNYTSYGYIVQLVGAPPDNGAHTLGAMGSAGPSATNTEQFGINLVANTSPSTFGADPLQVPDDSFGFGIAASGYNTANTYKYASGDTIASAPKSSGKTTFTISFIANIANNTPGGSYSGNQTLVATGTY